MDEALIIALYRGGLSLSAIGARLGVSHQTVVNRLIELGVSRRGTQEANQRRWPRVGMFCICGNAFGVRQSKYKRSAINFCSRACLYWAQQVAAGLGYPLLAVFGQVRRRVSGG